MSFNNIYLKNLKKFKERKALVLESGEILTYNQLDREAKLISKKLPKKKKLIFLLRQNNIETIIGYIAFIQQGFSVAILDFKINRVFLKDLIKLYNPSFIFCSRDNLKNLKNFKILLKFKTFVLTQNLSEKEYEINKDLMLLMSTSGTTGSPKLVRQSYKNIDSNTKNISKYLRINKEDVTITSLPFSYVYGLSVINSHLYSGSTIVLTNRSIIEKEFWNMVKKFHVNNFSGVPYSYSIIERIGKKNLPNKIRYSTQAGGKMNHELINKIINIYKIKKIKFIQMYGSAEATSRMSYLSWRDARKKLGSIGKPIPGGKFTLKDSKGKTIKKDNKKGELVYEGKNVCLGYAKNTKDLNLPDMNNGILYTGDLAYKDKEGFYFIVGRKNRYTKIFGIRADLAELESLFLKKGFDVVLKEGKENKIEVYNNNSAKIKKTIENIAQITGINLNVFQAKKLLKKHLTRNFKYKV